MEKTHRPGIAKMLVGMMSLLVFLFVLFAGRAFYTVASVRVGGATYDKIIEGKDLVADVLPPPEYIIESYLLTLQMSESNDPREIDALVEAGRRLRREYDTRHAHWDAVLPRGPLRSAMVERAHRAAIAFFEVRDRDFIPALRAGDTERAHALLRGPLRRNYDAHREDKPGEGAQSEKEEVDHAAGGFVAAEEVAAGAALVEACGEGGRERGQPGEAGQAPRRGFRELRRPRRAVSRELLLRTPPPRRRARKARPPPRSRFAWPSHARTSVEYPLLERGLESCGHSRARTRSPH